MNILSINLPVWLFVVETVFAIIGFIVFIVALMIWADKSRRRKRRNRVTA